MNFNPIDPIENVQLKIANGCTSLERYMELIEDLKYEIAASGIKKGQLSKILGVTYRTLKRKLDSGKFSRDDFEKIISYLNEEGEF